MYVRDVKSGICDGAAVPSIVKSSPATALVDGNNGLGPVVGNFCMDIATKKARETGVGWVAAKGENIKIQFHDQKCSFCKFIGKVQITMELPLGTAFKQSKKDLL